MSTSDDKKEPVQQVPPIRITQEARDRLQALADDESVTLSTLVVFAVAEYLDRYEKDGLPNGREERRQRTMQERLFRRGPVT